MVVYEGSVQLAGTPRYEERHISHVLNQSGQKTQVWWPMNHPFFFCTKVQGNDSTTWNNTLTRVNCKLFY